MGCFDTYESVRCTETRVGGKEGGEGRLTNGARNKRGNGRRWEVEVEVEGGRGLGHGMYYDYECSILRCLWAPHVQEQLLHWVWVEQACLPACLPAWVRRALMFRY